MIDFEKELLKLASPHIIHYCLIKHKITKFDDVDFIRQVVAENLEEIVDRLRYSVTYYDELKDGIKSEIKNNRNETAIILVGTYIELLLNEYYIQVLDFKYRMTKNNIEHSINSSTLVDKITWMYKLINNVDFDKKLQSWIKQVNSARNKAVHYKPFGKDNEEFINDKFTETIYFALDNVIDKIENLSNLIENSKSEILIGWDDAKEIAKKYLYSYIMLYVNFN